MKPYKGHRARKKKVRFMKKFRFMKISIYPNLNKNFLHFFILGNFTQEWS